MSKPWGGAIGSWAAEAEAEEREEAAAAKANSNNNNNNNKDLQSFPSLKEAVSTKPKKKKMSLAEFVSVSSSSTQGLTPAEMFQLPTGPKQRAPDDYSGGRIGGGFSNYGGGRRDRDGDSDSSWGGGGGRRSGFDEDRPNRRDYDIQPSRADEASDWGAGKKSMSSMSNNRGGGYDSLGGGGGGGGGGASSRADDSQSWNLGKKPVAAPPVRSTTFGSGFRTPSTDSDRWRRGGEEIPPSDRPRLVLDPRKVESTAPGNEASPKINMANNPFGAARPREDVLAEKGLDWKKIDSEMEAKKSTSGSRPTSSQGSRPSSAHSARSEAAGVAKPRVKVNPFGDAKPREVVLQEKGKDWRKMDLELEHRAIERPETEEEKALKAEIEDLKKELEKEPPGEPSQEPGADQTSLRDIVQLKERDLEILTRELDEKVRFSQKAVERPGSGAGRFGNFSDRPPSRSGSVDDARNVDFVDRPRSRGTGDWARSGEDRRGSFHGSRDRGFMGNRNADMGNRNADMGNRNYDLGSGNFDRSATRERW